ncbi:MAG: aldehyde dehydrogenase family protein [Acidobacteriia bacterium]|nr:aldehyde dehydrogenase family protein [Terriglobia bacterium]
MFSSKIFLAGKWQETKDTLEVRAPFNGELVGTCGRASAVEIDAAITESERGFKVMKSLPSYQRAAICSRVAAALRSRKEELAKTLAMEAGKPIKQARVELERAIFIWAVAGEEAKRIGGEVLPLDWMEIGTQRTGILRRFPIGPVAAITPFNFPLHLVSHKIAPALAAGNSVALKPASQTPLSALNLASVLAETEMPPAALSILPCTAAVAEALVTDERTKLFTFTGSPAVGWALKAKAGKKKVTLELGGNAGVVVHNDADLDFASTRIVTGGFLYAGQSCISVQRVFVQKQVHDDFLERLLTKTKRLKVGDPLDESTDVGPMIHESEAARVESWLCEAVDGGSTLLCGGGRSGTVLEPTILLNTKPEMKVNCQEIFAPVVTVTPYDTFDEALQAINQSRYGLQAGLFTRDLHSVFHAYEELEVGGVIAGDIPTWRVDHMPYGGVKDSGFGREGLRFAIEEMTEPKLLVLNLNVR